MSALPNQFHPLGERDNSANPFENAFDFFSRSGNGSKKLNPPV